MNNESTLTASQHVTSTSLTCRMTQHHLRQCLSVCFDSNHNQLDMQCSARIQSQSTFNPAQWTVKPIGTWGRDLSSSLVELVFLPGTFWLITFCSPQRLPSSTSRKEGCSLQKATGEHSNDIKSKKKTLTISKQINKAMTNNIYIFIDIKKERKMCNDSSIIFTQMFTSLLGPRIFSFLFLLSFPAPTSMMSAASPSSWRGKEKATQSASSIQPRLDQDQGTVNANPSKHTC